MSRWPDWTPLERFMSKVDKDGPDGCWLWTGAVHRGYGDFRPGGDKGHARAHRAAYEFMVGPIPEGMEVDHICFVRLCVNPEHLQLLTPTENRQRQRSALRNHCARGHEYTPENTIERVVGSRRCRACEAIYAGRRKTKQTVFADLTPPYRTIVADPPWSYGDRTAPWRSTSEQTYSLMSVDEIKALPVGALGAPDAHLYLWAVLPLMREAYEVVDAWGFTPDTVLTWCKPGPGLGAGYRGNTEHLIVARRGWTSINPTCAHCGGRARGAKKCACPDPAWRVNGRRLDRDAVQRQPFQAVAEGTWYAAQRGSHSEKPPLFLDLIERMSPGPYVELFARRQRLGWDSWGDGYESDRRAS